MADNNHCTLRQDTAKVRDGSISLSEFGLAVEDRIELKRH